MAINNPQELEALLEKARDAYYNTGETIMDDATYDALQESTGKPNPIGAKPRQDTRFPVLKHEIPMCSLNKAKTQAEVDGWIKSMKIDEPWLVCERKYDGLSLSATYDSNGNLENAILRGDGFEGENVLENAKKFIPESCNKIPNHRFILRGEVVISRTNFEKLPKDEYKNRRNCVSGIIRRLDGKYCDLLDLICYDIKLPHNPEALTSEVLKLALIKELESFKVAQIWHYSPQLLIELEKERDGEYMMDGVVIKHNDSIKTQKIGIGANGNPLYQIAYKFPSEAGVTHVTDVKWEINANKLTPVAIVEPITMQGSTIKRVSLAGLNQFKKLDLRKNSMVHIKRANDVIPVLDKKMEIQDREGEKFEIPTTCEACGSEVIENETGSQLCCKNPNCIGKVSYILAADLKVVLKTKGFGKSLIDQLANSGKITSILSLFELSSDEICSGSSMSLDRSKKFYEILHSALKECSSDKLLLLFGIEGVGEKKLKEIKDESILNILEYTLEECQSKFGKAAGNKFFKFKEDYKNDIIKLNEIKMGN